ncbi:DDRGK domain-containing protein 1-like [Capsicum chacoense]
MLLAKDSTKVVDTKLIRIVDSLSFFEKYLWGKETFQLTMDYLKNKSDLKKQKEVFDEKQKASYALFGFPWALTTKLKEEVEQEAAGERKEEAEEETAAEAEGETTTAGEVRK